MTNALWTATFFLVYQKKKKKKDLDKIYAGTDTCGHTSQLFLQYNCAFLYGKYFYVMYATYIDEEKLVHSLCLILV